MHKGIEEKTRKSYIPGSIYPIMFNHTRKKHYYNIIGPMWRNVQGLTQIVPEKAPLLKSEDLPQQNIIGSFVKRSETKT